MTIELLIAPAATGKTASCIDRLRTAQKENPLAQVWVFVPNLQAAAQFRSRLAASGGGMGAKIGFFHHFYQDILEENGRFVPVISRALSHRLIQETVREVSASGNLSHYDAIKEKPGFFSVLKDSFAELRSALVTPEALLDYTRGSTPARHELAILYERFLARLGSLGWVDSEGQAWLAIEALENNSATASNVSLVVVDGFTAFTTAQRKFLELLGQQVDEMVITLTGELESKRMVHRRAQKVLQELEADISPIIVAINHPSHLAAPILQMEKHVLDPEEVERLELQAPILLETRSQSEEAREALRWIKQLHVRQDVPLNKCAIYTADLNTYQSLLRAAADEFGLNVRFSQQDPLAESPAILSMLNLLTLPLENFPTRALLNALHSPYFIFDLDNQDVEDLEKVSQQAIIVTGKDQWDAAWKMLARKRQDYAEVLDEERYRPDLTAGVDLPGLKQRLDGFWNLFTQIETTHSQAGWVEWLEAMLKKLSFYDNNSTERDRAACSSLGEALRALVISEKVVGTKDVDYAHFISDLQGVLNGTNLEEPSEARKNAIFVGKLVEARGSRYQAVALLGFSEGLFPIVENPDPFLDEELRKDLGLEPRLQREQASTFYQAFTRADTHLLLTRPYLSKDGEPWEPSPYWQAAKALFKGRAIIKIKSFEGRPQAEAASPQELLFWGVQQGQLIYAEDNELQQRWQNLANAHRILDARRAKHAEGVYEGDLFEQASSLAQRYSAGYSWSASRLEAYGNCPYFFFVNSALNLDITKPLEPGLDSAQVGSLYHRILELIYSESTKNHTNPLDILDDVASRVFKDAPEMFGFRPSALWEVEKSQHLEKLRKSLQALEAERGAWQPIGFEKKFGIQGAPPLELRLNGRIILLHGVIDRVDHHPNGQTRVIDYKTGGSHLGELELKKGLRLQLPIYALAAQDALRLGEVVDGFYWKINDARPGGLKLSKFKAEEDEGIKAAYHVAKEYISSYVSKIQEGSFRPEPPSDGCPDYCPASQWCWRYQARYNND